MEALLTSIFGLCFSIPLFAGYHLLVSRIERVTRQMEVALKRSVCLFSMIGLQMEKSMSKPQNSHQTCFSWTHHKSRRKYQFGFLGGAFLFDIAMLWVGFMSQRLLLC